MHTINAPMLYVITIETPSQKFNCNITDRAWVLYTRTRDCFYYADLAPPVTLNWLILCTVLSPPWNFAKKKKQRTQRAWCPVNLDSLMANYIYTHIYMRTPLNTYLYSWRAWDRTLFAAWVHCYKSE